MDLGSIGGIALGLGMIVFVGIGPSKIGMFLDIPSMAIVMGGTLGAIFVSYPLKNVINLTSVFKNIFSSKAQDPVSVIKQIVEFAEQARREGILCLEARSQEVEDEFLRKGIQLAVDGTEPELIKDIMQTEINYIDERHNTNYGIMAGIGGLAPAFGMVGTLIGLVLMLANMSDPNAIGPAMAVALITTLYGAIVANLFFIPFESKLKTLSLDEVQMKTLMLEGVMSLQSGDNPKIVQWKLESFVDPNTRVKLGKK
ncbi:MAG: motility protein A [Fibrobacteria bacterium]|nr:motility protein A [Fibrobacteria bacterium]